MRQRTSHQENNNIIFNSFFGPARSRNSGFQGLRECHELKKSLNVKITAGIRDGERIRLKRHGLPISNVIQSM